MLSIRREESTCFFWTLSNGYMKAYFVNQRNVLALYSSDDLGSWKRRATILEDDSDLSPEESAERTGFQYASWQFDGADIVFALRTAYNGAANYHDSNRITFHRIRDFRSLQS